MSKTILYYGSGEEIRKPIYHFDRPYNDYGLGFYCTEEKDIAKEWACPDDSSDGVLNRYSIDLSKMKVLNLCDKSFSALNWIAILLKNRHFDIASPLAKQAKDFLLGHYLLEVGEYDVVIGYRADDSYFSFAKDFIKNVISLEQLSLALTLGKLGKQTVLISKKAFDEISFEGSEAVDGKIYFAKKASRDLKARFDYRENRKRGSSLDETYILDLMRKEGKKNG